MPTLPDPTYAQAQLDDRQLATWTRTGHVADAVEGALRPGQVITWLREDEQPQELTGALLTGTIRSKGQQRAIDGALLVKDAPGGVFLWLYAAADVAEAGTFDVQFTASFANGRSPARSYSAVWVVRDWDASQ